MANVAAGAIEIGTMAGTATRLGLACGEINLGGKVPDSAPPSVDSFTPADGATITNSDAIACSVTDASGSVNVTALVSFDVGVSWQIAVFANSVINGSFSGSVATITDGKSITFAKRGGWPKSNLQVQITATDVNGNSVTSFHSYVVSNPVDEAPPVIGDPAPASGVTITNSQHVVFSISDDSGILADIKIQATYDNGSTWEDIYTGGVFSYAFRFSSDTIGATRSIDLVREFGWVNPTLIRVYLTDKSGNVATRVFTYQVSNTITPQVSNQNPAPGQPLGIFDTVSFDVTADRGLDNALIFAQQNARELIHDGAGFVFPYIGSFRLTITDGFRFQVRRVGGWDKAPTFYVSARDTLGVES